MGQPGGGAGRHFAWAGFRAMDGWDRGCWTCRCVRDLGAGVVDDRKPAGWSRWHPRQPTRRLHGDCAIVRPRAGGLSIPAWSSPRAQPQRAWRLQRTEHDGDLLAAPLRPRLALVGFGRRCDYPALTIAGITFAIGRTTASVEIRAPARFLVVHHARLRFEFRGRIQLVQ